MMTRRSDLFWSSCVYLVLLGVLAVLYPPSPIALAAAVVVVCVFRLRLSPRSGLKVDKAQPGDEDRGS